MPGGVFAKTVQAVFTVAVLLVLLFLVVFPWASTHVPFLQVTVESSGTGQSNTPPASTPSVSSPPVDASPVR